MAPTVKGSYPWSDKGVYVLLFEARQPVVVGRLGLLAFDGWYLYVGSALGPGGLKRVSRHFRKAQNPTGLAHWHVDALLGSGTLWGAMAAATRQRMECDLAEALGRYLTPAYRGFGSTDCRCATHLFYAPSREEAWTAAASAFHALGLGAHVPPIDRR